MSYPSSPPRIPWEVIEHIIDALHFDVLALRQIAATCRAILPRSRYHLFCAIRFQPTREDTYPLCDFLDANKPLAAIVEVVTVYFPGRSRPAKSLVEVFPAFLIKRLPSVRHWKLFTGATRSPETPVSFHRATLALLRTTIHLETLELKDITFTSITEFVRLLTSIPWLRSLRCSNISVKSPMQLRHYPSWSIRTLCFAGRVHMSLLRTLIKLSSATLEELQLGYSQICVDEDPERFNDLHLQSLASLVIFDDGDPGKCGVPRSFVETCIKKICLPSLKRLIVVTSGGVHLFAIIPAKDCSEHHSLRLCCCGKGTRTMPKSTLEGEFNDFPLELGSSAEFTTVGGKSAHRSRNGEDYSTSTAHTQTQWHNEDAFHPIHCTCSKEPTQQQSGHLPLFLRYGGFLGEIITYPYISCDWTTQSSWTASASCRSACYSVVSTAVTSTCLDVMRVQVHYSTDQLFALLDFVRLRSIRARSRTV